MLNDGFDRDTVLRVTGLAPATIWRLKAINLAEWSGPAAYGCSDDFGTSSAPDKRRRMRDKRRMGRLRHYALMYCAAATYRAKGTILRADRRNNHTNAKMACSFLGASRRSTVFKISVAIEHLYLA